MSRPSLDADLAHLRALAEEGRARPLLGGRQFVIFGLAFGAASLVHAAIALRWLPWPPLGIAAVWFGLLGGAAVLARRGAGAKRASLTIGTQVERAVWQAGGWVLAALSLAVFAFAMATLARTGSAFGFVLFALLPPVVFGVYAIAMAASAAAAPAPFLRPYAAASIGFLVLTVLLAGSVWQYFVTAAGAVAVSILPGFALLRHERRDGATRHPAADG